MKRDVIIALDFKDGETALNFLDKFQEEKPFVKVGMELFFAEGPSIVKEIKRRGHKIFLDLKLHDSPNTVKGGMRSLTNLGADILNVHAAGTIEMMKAALEGTQRPDGTAPMLIAVTQLTSTSEERMQKDLLINATINDTILHYAKNAKEAGLAGVVCSPLEAGMVKAALGKDFVTVTRYQICRQRKGRPGSYHNTGKSKRNRHRLYCCRPSYYTGRRPCCRIPPLYERICRRGRRII